MLFVTVKYVSSDSIDPKTIKLIKYIDVFCTHANSFVASIVLKTVTAKKYITQIIVIITKNRQIEINFSKIEINISKNRHELIKLLL